MERECTPGVDPVAPVCASSSLETASRSAAEMVPVQSSKENENVDSGKEEKTTGIGKNRKTESDDIMDNFVLRQLLRKPRYFDSPYYGLDTSTECFQEGDIAGKCAMRKRKSRKQCFFCGSSRHIWRHCKQNQYCSVCQNRGHLSRHCLEKDQADQSKSAICLRCGHSGHDMSICQSDFSPEDLKEIRCYGCRKLGHVWCGDFPNLGPKEPTCYNCGESGHVGSSCEVMSGSEDLPACYKCGKRGHIARRCHNHGRRRKSDALDAVQELPPDGLKEMACQEHQMGCR